MKTNLQMNNIEVSKYLRISLRTLYTLMATGEIPSQKIKGARVFFLVDVNKALLKERASMFDLHEPLVLLNRHEAAAFLGRGYWSVAHESDPSRKIKNPVPFVTVGDQFRYIAGELEAHKHKVDNKHGPKVKDVLNVVPPTMQSASAGCHEP